MTANADDFLARAQALGLRLSRTDYERTRAGVAAFLKAERVPTASPSHTTTTTGEATDEQVTSPTDTEHTRDVTPQLSRWLRTTSGQLSFFTAVVRPMQTQPADEQRTRVSLDEVGSAEEKRRRRLRRRRMLEKQMFLEHGTPTHTTAPSTPVSTAEPSTPTTHAAADVPIPNSRDTSATDSQLDSPLSVSTSAYAPSHDVAVSRAPSPPASPDMNVLNRMARVDPGGKLWLAPSNEAREPPSEDSISTATQADEPSLATKDSDDASSHALQGWGPRTFARAPSGTTEHLNACMKNMSLLDRIMMRKTSPRRMRREAKARRERAQAEEEDAADTSNASMLPSHGMASDSSVSVTADTSMSSWADISSDYTSDEKASEPGVCRGDTSVAFTPVRLHESLAPAPAPAPAPVPSSSSTPAPAHRASHSRHASLSSLRRVHAVSTPLHRRKRSNDELVSDVSPFAMLTPISRFDPTTQITPMRYSPSMGLDYSYSRSTLAFSPNLITPWTHQGRLMSNAGLSNMPSSPFVSGEWSGSAHLVPSAPLSGNSTGASTLPSSGASNFALSSTPLSHLPSHDPDLSAPFLSSPSRLQCIESFPGRSPQGRDMLPSPVKRPLLTSPLASKSQSRHASHSAIDRHSPTTPMPVTVNKLSPLWKQVSSLETRTPLRRTDTISPADIFGASASGAPSTIDSVEHMRPPVTSSTPISAARHITASPRSVDDDERGPPSPDSRSAHVGASRMRMARRKSAMSRTASAASTMTPAHGDDDVFAKENVSAKTAIAPQQHAPQQTPVQLATPVQVAAQQPAFKDVCNEMLASSDSQQTVWDQPDGSRYVKLVSEELQAALNSGTLDQEPEPRYFRLPPGHGASKAKPSSVSYAGLIGQAILSSSDGRLSLAEIYLWISSVYPYYERGDRGWQNSIRHNLSLNKSFMKLERESSIPGKGGWWAIQPGHESRFQNGLYLPNGGRLDAPPSQRPARTATAPTATPTAPPAIVPAAVQPDERARRKRTPLTPGDPNTLTGADPDANETLQRSSTKRPKTTRPLRFMPIDPSSMVQRPASEGISSPPMSTSPSHDSKVDTDSFDTSTSRSLLATPGKQGSTADVAAGPILSMQNAYRMSPSMQVRSTPSSAHALMEVSNAPASDLYSRAYPRMTAAECGANGMMYMNPELSFSEFGSGLPPSSAPTAPGMPGAAVASMPMHTMPMPFSHLQAHVPVVPAPYPRYTPEQGAPFAWPDAAVRMDYKRDAPW